jgi:LL-diaminopimelate aminotransferase
MYEDVVFEYNPNVLKILGYPSAQLAARKKKLIEAGMKVYDFGTGDPIEPTASFIRAAVGEATPAVSQYPGVRGSAELRKSVAGYLERRFKVDCDPDKEIIQCTGSKESIYNLVFLMVGPQSKKKTVIAPAPGYPVMDRSAIVAGAKLHPYYLNAENKFLLELSTLPKSVLEDAAIAWINYPHNPTGAECDLAYLERQVKCAKEYGILLCSDECYIDIYFGQNPPPSILQVTREGVLAFHSCSKRSGMTAYRTGFIAGDREVLDKYASYRDNLGVATPVYTQAAATKAWADDAHVAERISIFRQKRQLFTEFLDANGFDYIKTNATFYFWIKAPGSISGKDYALKLMERGLIVSPGDFFADNCAQYFRIALVPSIEDCKKAIQIWKETL